MRNCLGGIDRACRLAGATGSTRASPGPSERLLRGNDPQAERGSPRPRDHWHPGALGRRKFTFAARRPAAGKPNFKLNRQGGSKWRLWKTHVHTNRATLVPQPLVSAACYPRAGGSTWKAGSRSSEMARMRCLAASAAGARGGGGRSVGSDARPLGAGWPPAWLGRRSAPPPPTAAGSGVLGGCGGRGGSTTHWHWPSAAAAAG